MPPFAASAGTATLAAAAAIMALMAALGVLPAARMASTVSAAACQHSVDGRRLSAAVTSFGGIFHARM